MCPSAAAVIPDLFVALPESWALRHLSALAFSSVHRVQDNLPIAHLLVGHTGVKMSLHILAWSFTLGQSLTELDAIISPLLIQCSPFAFHECQSDKVAETYVIYFQFIHSFFSTQDNFILFYCICAIGFQDDVTAHILTFLPPAIILGSNPDLLA